MTTREEAEIDRLNAEIHKLKNEKKTPPFFIDFNAFANYGRMVEATLIVSQNWELSAVSDILHDVSNARVLTLMFRPIKPQKGRRIFSLKEEAI